MTFNSVLKFSLMLFLFTILSACTVISKKECLAGNWKTIGYEIGIKGDINNYGAFNKRQNICAKHGAIADQQQFLSGYNIGLEQYCHIDNALLLGTEGAYNVINDYREGFFAGYKLHNLQQAISETESIIYRIDSEISSYELDRRLIYKQLHSKDTNSTQKKVHRKRLNYINHQIHFLKREIYYNERIGLQQERDVQEYEFFLKDAYPHSFKYSYEPPK